VEGGVGGALSLIRCGTQFCPTQGSSHSTSVLPQMSCGMWFSAGAGMSIPLSSPIAPKRVRRSIVSIFAVPGWNTFDRT
jgi:hypothetical protein